MCSRFELNHTPRLVSARFGLTVPPPWPNHSEMRPTDAALVIGPGGQGRLLRWGLEVSWDKRPLINARAETLSTRPAFQRLLGARVLVPASAWWEWMPDGKGKAKMRLSRADGELFALAGLVDGERFTIVTCAAAPAIAHVHDRMPALLPPEAEAAWVDPAAPFDQVAAALSPFAGELQAERDGAPPAQGDLFA